MTTLLRGDYKKEQKAEEWGLEKIWGVRVLKCERGKILGNTGGTQRNQGIFWA